MKPRKNSGRADMIAHHDELVEQYNATDDRKLLDQIAFLEMLLILDDGGRAHD
jgi:hypothetical protein